jgi:glycosyltransferase involved in cell wall biosynthesis
LLSSDIKKIKPIFLADFNCPVLSGGYRRTYQILRLGKSEGIEYVIVTSLSSIRNAAQMFPDYMKVLSNYKVYIKDFEEKSSSIPGLKQLLIYKNILRSAFFVSKIALVEHADLIVGNEGNDSMLTSYLAGKLSSKPWAVVFQPTSELFEPSPSIGSLNILNILRFVNEKLAKRKLSLLSRIGFALSLFVQLRIAEKSLMLSVSKSVGEDLQPMDPKIIFKTIEPGNGVDLTWSSQASESKKTYDAIFFARLLPEKGIFDLPIIWKFITEKEPTAILAVAGITEDQNYVDALISLLNENGLDQNVIFLGKLDENTLVNSVKASKLTLYPSILDSFSLVTLESLACGTPVIAYDIPAIRFNFGNCTAVFRCPVKDIKSMAEKALEIIRNEKFRNMLSSKAKQYTANYSWRNVVRAEKEAYLEVVSSSKAKHTS